MEKIIILLIICSNSLIYSQSSIGLAVYNLHIVFDKEAMEVDKKYGYIQKAIDVSKQLEYKLVFKKKESNFYQDLDNKLDKVSVNMANILSDTPKMCYQNIEKNIYLRELNADGIIIKSNEFIIADTLKLEWQITNESKLIDNYLCYKASTLKKITKGDKTFNENVTAWFCPSIPYPFGPTKYSGLPGLILELQEKNIAFTLKSLSINENSITNINIPTAKKIISQEEYDKIVLSRMETFESMSKQK